MQVAIRSREVAVAESELNERAAAPWGKRQSSVRSADALGFDLYRGCSPLRAAATGCRAMSAAFSTVLDSIADHIPDLREFLAVASSDGPPLGSRVVRRP